MTAPVYDIQARRAARTRDAATVCEDARNGAQSLQALFASLPYQAMTEAKLIGAERTLVALQHLLFELRAFVSTRGGPHDAG